MSVIELDRRFLPLGVKDRENIDAYSLMRSSYFVNDWHHILGLFRVVVLAEAGSGKTTELKAQAEAVGKEGQFSFYATVQDVAREGLDSATGKIPEIAKWKKSDKPAWFFIDSVDEAKFDGVRLETALRRLSDGIEGARSRAHIVISGRYTDWEFRGDLERLVHYLPIPSDEGELDEPTSNAVIVSALDGETPRKKTEEKPTVFLMAPLDEDRVRTFAHGKKVKNVDGFIAALDEAGLWTFARRPIDLDWLTTYWMKRGRFGTRAEMMETSLRERLREPDPQRARRDAIDTETALHALERIGAALVFGRMEKIAVPDSTAVTGSNKPEFELAEILPEWSEAHLRRLLTRAVFDPATYGHIRLHNDNEGSVRAFLAARWLAARKKQNCSARALNDLLFASVYGLSVIKPSLRETAAWLAIHDRDVAREIVAREPVLLLTAGDPASLSIDTRREALHALAKELRFTNETHLPIFEGDALRRFSTPDLIPDIRKLWATGKSNQGIRELVLRMIWVGRLEACADIAEEAAFGDFSDRYTSVFSMRALLATASAPVRARYANKIKKDFVSLQGIVVWESLEDLFPVEITIPELFTILRAMPESTRDETIGLGYRAEHFVEKLKLKADLDAILVGFLDLVGPHIRDDDPESPIEKALFPAIDQAAVALTDLADPDDVPTSAMRAAFRLGEDRFYRGGRRDAPKVPDKLRRTTKRRERMLWSAVDQFRDAGSLHGKPLISDWQLEFLGWCPGLKKEDLGWLLGSLKTRTDENERSVAVNASMRLWRDSGKPPDMLRRIRATVKSDPKLSPLVTEWTKPPPISPAERKLNRQMATGQAKRAKEKAKRDKSWIEFIRKIKADPDKLRNPPAPTPDRVDGRLFYLWELLHRLDDSNSNYAIESVAPLAAVVGEPVASAERDGLINMWRQWTPTLESQRPANQRNTISKIDCMGIAGVTLEAAGDQNWPAKLSSTDATRAAMYGTLELNGFPKWVTRLAAAFPNEVQTVLMAEVHSELDDMDGRFAVLHDLSYGPVELARIVFKPLLDQITAREAITPKNLSLALRVLSAGAPDDDKGLGNFALAKFVQATDPELEAAYAAAAFRRDPVGMTEALTKKLDGLDAPGQTILAQRLLPQMFGTRFTEQSERVEGIPFDVLVRLVDLAFQTIRIEDDNQHSGAYTPDDRDNAERARGMLFTQLIETPGRATFDVLNRLARRNGFAISPQRLLDMAATRASKDAEHSPWGAVDAHAFETDCDTVPVSPLDLQRVAMRRISDIEHNLLNADFAQGLTLKSLPDEPEVQKWVANELRAKQGRAYSVEREPHVVEEKEPDIRLRTKAGDGSLPIEIKVAESCSLPQLEEAITTQLAGRYLRDQDGKHGILLLVHQQLRPVGWFDAGGNALTFPEVVAHLERIAETVAGGLPPAPQARIAVIDVSGVPERKQQKTTVQAKSRRRQAKQRSRR